MSGRDKYTDDDQKQANGGQTRTIDPDNDQGDDGYAAKLPKR